MSERISAEHLKATITLNQVLEAHNLTKQLKPDPEGLRGKCPFCQAKKSFYAYKDDKFYCHSCKASGSIIDLTMNLKDLSFREACKHLNKTFKQIYRDAKPAQSSKEDAGVKGEASKDTPLKEYFDKLWDLLETIDADGTYYDALGAIEDAASTYMDSYTY